MFDHVGLTAFIKFRENPEKKELYRRRMFCDLSIGEAEQISSDRKKGLEQFAANNDVVCYSMRMREDDED